MMALAYSCMVQTFRLGSLLMGWAILVSFAGCGAGDGPQRYQLSGCVTYQGKPVPAGSVSFIPDTSKGNHGPGGSVMIKDGRFDTRQGGMGHVGGPHLIVVTGLDGVSIPDMPNGKPLFADFQMSGDLPKQDSTQDIDVPAGKKARP